MGASFPAEIRIRAMRNAQAISAVVYIVFFLLLSPLFPELQKGDGVAAVISVSAAVAAILPLALTVAATGSQLSASVADSIGDVGLIRELTHGKVDARHAYVLIAVVGVGLLAATRVAGVIALASRAFALFYMLQCLVAWEAARKRPEDRRKSWAFLALAFTSGAVFLFGTSAG